MYRAWYNAEHTSPELLETRAFGLPELFAGDLASAAATRAAGDPVLVACAGCYPTATSLAALPAIKQGWVADAGAIVVDAISGVTEPARGPAHALLQCGREPGGYGVAHRHTPEIEQILDAKDRVVFTPHLAPLKRGQLPPLRRRLLRTLWAMTVECDEVVAAYREFCCDSPAVRVLDAGRCPRPRAWLKPAESISALRSTGVRACL